MEKYDFSLLTLSIKWKLKYLKNFYVLIVSFNKDYFVKQSLL